MANFSVSRMSDGNNVGYFAPQVFFTCSTAADTAAKIASATNNITFTNTSLVTGITIFVKFTNSNSASNPTLQVGSSTAKSIAGGTTWAQDSVIAFTYDGTSWVCAASTGGGGGGFTVAEGTVTSN